jgi:hypothetical protein
MAEPKTRMMGENTMAEAEYRLGDWVDDYCTRCKLIMNHYIVSMLNGEIVKVRCQTCNHEQDFRHCREGKKKNTKQALFDQVAASLPTFGTPPPNSEKAGKKKMSGG